MSDKSLFLCVVPPLGILALTFSEATDARERAKVFFPEEDVTQEDSIVRWGKGGRQLVGVDEAARTLNVPSSWLMKQARENRIPNVPLGKYRRFDIAAIVGHCSIGPGADTRIGYPQPMSKDRK